MNPQDDVVRRSKKSFLQVKVTNTEVKATVNTWIALMLDINAGSAVLVGGKGRAIISFKTDFAECSWIIFTVGNSGKTKGPNIEPLQTLMNLT